MDEYLESANLQWSELIKQLRDDYIQMFDQLSFNIFGENTGKDRLYKTREWYLHKAFKWYATLARSRGLSTLEEDLLYQYEHFQGSEAELSYLARYRYYARLAPSRSRPDDVDRDLARAASIAYARARNLPLAGEHLSTEGAGIIPLEAVPENFAAAARTFLRQIGTPSPDRLGCCPAAERILFADNLPAPACVQFEGHSQASLIPAEWSMVFCDSYVRQVLKQAAEVMRSIPEQNVREALAVLLASLVKQASQLPT